ncbi:MAG: hypothetical protein IJ287_11325 [Methanobrevibacter sp.]|nr:hypothetical protein [Methanobrevibacter sp.]
MKIKYLIFAVLLFILTISAASASDNLTQIDSQETDSDLSSDFVSESENINSTETADNSMGFGDENLTTSAENNNEISYDNKYYLFRGDCWTLNNNIESSAAITSESLRDFTVSGTFRTENDLVGVYWNSEDPIQHPYISYGNRCDYSNVVLEFDYEMAGCMDFSNNAINIIITTNDGDTYFLTMNRFIKNNHVALDFNNLKLLPGNSYVDKNGKSVVVSNETRLDVSNLESVMFELLPVNFVQNNSQYRIMDNADFYCKISNINVINGEIHNENPALAPHQYRLCEGYDDMYNLNPFRISKEMRKLGYAEWVDFYIGASFFYEKSGVAGDVIDDLGFNHNRTEKMVLDKNVPLNVAFSAWLDCYARELKNNGVNNLVISVSMENLQCPQSWRQMDSEGNFAMSGWSPATFFYSPCNDDVILYMQKVSESCLDIVADNGFQPILQMGETWWWWSENDWSSPAPCFYDDSTKAKYLLEHDSELPVYCDVWESEYDVDAMKWLNKQLCQYSDALREVVKGDKYSNGLYFALLFTPSVISSDRVPQMISDVNYIKDAYSPDKLDILQIEDYDWVIFESPHHNESYEIGQQLGFANDCLHYFGGFVQYPEDADKYWDLIKKSMDDAIKKGFKEAFVWAGLQIRRDNKIIGYDEDELMENLSLTTLSTPGYVSVGEKFTIEMHTQKWVNGNLSVYAYDSNKKGELMASSAIVNGSSLLVLSLNNIGFNKLYFEFDYSGGLYYLIEDVHVIENSKNVRVDIPDEIETGSDVIISLNDSEVQQSFVHVSVDEKVSDSYDVKNGQFSMAISDLSAGFHRISIKYDSGKQGGEMYSGTFTVNVCDKTVMGLMDANAIYTFGERLTVILKDIKGNPLNGRDILISLNGLNHTVVSDDEGHASLPIDLISGNYSLEMSFMGDEGLFSSFNSTSITVNKITTQITAPTISTTYNVAKNLLVTLKDINGNVLAEQDVLIKLNGKSYNGVSDKNGQIKLSVSLPAKKYSAIISFAGTGVYTSSTKAVKVVVNKATPKLAVSSKTFKVKAKTKKVTATLKTNKNKAISKVTVYLKVNKKTYKVKTNSKGVATFKIKLTKKGKYTAIYKFSGNSNFKSVSKKFKITIK